MTSLSKGLAAGLMSAFMAVTAMAQGAEAASYTERERLWMPQEGSEQYNMLKPHEDFIKNMRGCCTMLDGRGDLEEIINDGSDPRFPANEKYSQAKYPYILLITHDLAGKELEEPTVVYVPKEKILNVKDARSICKPMRLTDPNSTCIPPMFNVLWAYDNSDETSYQIGMDKHRITTLYCYYPRPGGM
ncbi:MAG: hypothetical protein LRY76_08965 [Alphaproteobacteria bacterium]|nr:hypothetical protein [Alphaproteobacteria bacterium]MCD8571624.1 hypothetical protein [Alphaproteobacteria bacterium]